MIFDPLFLLVFAGYLTGSVSAAIITCKMMGLEDPRSSGSNNPGATNVLRIGGKKAAIITLFGDMLKGLLPVVIIKLFNVEDTIIALVAIGAFLGHLFPIFFKFQYVFVKLTAMFSKSLEIINGCGSA